MPAHIDRKFQNQVGLSETNMEVFRVGYMWRRRCTKTNWIEAYLCSCVGDEWWWWCGAWSLYFIEVAHRIAVRSLLNYVVCFARKKKKMEVDERKYEELEAHIEANNNEIDT